MTTNEEFYRGRIDQINEIKRTTVRIFVSSTFTDTVEERDLLIGNVYPVLRQYCLEKYNVQFQYADMRWGIQAQADTDHSTEELCFQELDRCCQFSLATNCVILLSHRYGTRMVPARIEKEIFEKLQSVLPDDERMLINEVYQLDENQLDAVYILRPIDPTKRDEWDGKQKQLQKILRRASDLCYQKKMISENVRNEFHISVTAKEIYRALKHNEHQTERMVVFLRNIEDMDTMDPTIKKKFVDSNDEAKDLFDQTKTDIRHALPQQNIYTYSVKWNDSANKTKYLDTFKNDFIEALKRQIDYHLSKRGSKNALYDEVLEHANQCKRLQKEYFPRSDIIDQIKRYVVSHDNKQPCTIYGDSGTGKSSIMAQVAIQASSWFSKRESVSVIIRFLGATPSTSDIRRPLISIIEQICVIYNKLPLPTIDSSTTIQDIKRELEQLLENIPKDQILILLLDSIDQLQPDDYDCSKWLPRTYPSNVKCLLSTIPVISIEQKQYSILDGIVSLVGNRNLIEILPFNESMAENVFNFWLAHDRRRLTATQWTWIKPKLSKNRQEPTPLFLSLLYDLTSTWHSFDNEVDPNFIKIETTVATIEYLYGRLAQKHGEVLFRRALSYLWLSDGLNESELEDILTADNEVLQHVFAHYLPPTHIFRLPSTLWIRIRNDISKYLVEKEVDNTTIIYFYHRSFQMHPPAANIRKNYDIIRHAYFAGHVGGYPNLHDQLFPLESTKLAKKYGFPLNDDHQCLIKVDRHLTPQQPYVKYIKGQGHVYNMRRINQLIKNVHRQITWDLGFLFDFQFLYSYFHCYKMQYRLLECYVNSPEMRFLILQLKIASAILDDYPDNVAFEILRQLSPIADVLPTRTYKLLQQCQNRCALYPLNNRTEWVIRYSIGPVRSMQVSSYVTWILVERKLLAFYSPDNKWLTARYVVYDLNSADYIHMSCSMIFVCVYSSRSIQVLAWNMHVLDPVLQIDVDEAIHVTFVEGRFLIVCARQSQLVEIWNCLTQTKVDTFHFHAPLRHCTTVVFSRRIMRNIAVTKIELDSNETYYVKLIEPIDPNSDQNRFKLCRSPDHKLGKDCVLWKSNTSIFYDEKKTNLHLNEFSPDLVTESFHTINNVPPVTHPICVTFSKLFETAVVWFTHDSAVILHTCGNYFTIPGTYDDVCLESYGPSGITDVICFYNSREFKFNFFQLKCSQNEHQYRPLGQLQLDKAVQFSGWRSDLSAGLILHCIFNGTEFHTYYITVADHLPNQAERIHENSEINQFEIFNDHIVTLDRTNKLIKVFRMSPNLVFINQYQLPKKVSQMVLNSSHILLVDSDNTIFVYSIDDSKTPVFNTNRFQYDVIRVYSVPFIFYIVNGTTSQVLALDVRKPFQLVTRIEWKFSCRTLISSFMPEQSSLSILSEDQTVVATWNSKTDTLNTNAVHFDDQIRIQSMFTLPNALVFHSNDRCVYVQMKDVKESAMNFGAADLIATKTNFLALFDRTQKKLSIYNLETKQQGERYPNVLCDLLHFTDDGKYLFGISSTESMVVMYDVRSGKRLERLFLENLSSACARTINDCLMISCNEKICSLTITEKDAAPTLTERDDPSQQSLLFEKRSWSQCYDDVPWIDASIRS